MRPARRVILLLGVVLVVTGAFNFARWHWDLVTSDAPDFDINWVAAHQLTDRDTVYDPEASRALGTEIVGPDFAVLNQNTYTRFIGTPATALLYVPFTGVDVETARDRYRVVETALMLASIVIVGCALPRRVRLPAVLVGIGAFLWLYPVAMAIRLGNVDGFVLLALATAVWASARGRWRVTGGMLGFATLLKISPGVLLVYLVIRGRREVVLPAVAVAGVLLAIAAIVGHPSDLGTWFSDVLPDVGQGGFFTNNQSTPAALARVFGSNDDWLSYSPTLGWWRIASWLVLAAGVAAVLRVRWNRPHVPLELGAVVLVALLAGPITWDFYISWALVPIVLMADARWWTGRTVRETVLVSATVLAALAALRRWTLYPLPEQVASTWTLRLETAMPTVAVLMLFAVALAFLARPRDADDPTEPSPTSTPANVG